MTLEEFGELVTGVLDEIPAPLQRFLDGYEFDVSEGSADGELSGRERLELGARGRWGAPGIIRVTLSRAAFEAQAPFPSDLRGLVREELLRRITEAPDEDEEPT